MYYLQLILEKGGLACAEIPFFLYPVQPVWSKLLDQYLPSYRYRDNSPITIRIYITVKMNRIKKPFSAKHPYKGKINDTII